MNDMMKSVVADTILESSDKKSSNHSVRKTVERKLKKANVERSGIVKVTGHKNIQSLNDYDEANEDEQRQLSYAISGRNNFNSQPRAAFVFNSISSTAESVDGIATDLDAQFFSAWIKTKFHIAQPDNDESSRTKSVEHFHYCQLSFNFKSCKSPRPAIPITFCRILV